MHQVALLAARIADRLRRGCDKKKQFQYVVPLSWYFHHQRLRAAPGRFCGADLG
jgi:hypothetical protein